MASSTPYCVGPRPAPSFPPTAQLQFQLPPALILRAAVGRYVPALHQVGLDVGDDGTVTIHGYHGLLRDAAPALLDQAARFLLTLNERTMAPQSFSAELLASNSARPERFLIVLGARVVIAQGARALLAR
jgi:hypothetical protein